MENNNKKIRVSQKAILFDKNKKILVIRRSKTAPSQPLFWDFPGGELDFGEDAKKGIIREIKEETQLEVKNLNVIDVISGLDDRNEFWVTICYATQLAISKIKLSYEHDDFRWININEFEKLKMSPRNKKFVEKFKNISKISILEKKSRAV
ncbi:MAG: hypothetical protein A2271_02625 [Candidatus Moranbacteria bacterium RIFOXYA12_FULL_35_19]|nr:MAG: hypothetical protein A2489_00140 [Candidatus Moranbacteria bacterium RIFOXYC12_FULL_36_13]OGI36694.1 MAG: hypothetical protein A2271_02625 [Candidatus Moranbacteria bacterium RIFOXYA12_FULL_35_19]